MSLATNVFKSSGFMVFGSLFQKSAGLISTLVLARLLLPEDFGKVAFLALTVNFFNVLSITGTQQYILSKEQVDDEDLNTAISLDLLMKGAFWLVLIGSSLYICEFFNMVETHSALLVLSITILIKAARNPGFYLHQKELNYKLLFQVELIAKIFSVLVVISLAFLYQSYWAIVIGDLISSVVLLLGSYKLHSYRPRFSLQRLKVQWSFSKWLFFKGVVGYSKSNFDQMFVTRNFDASTTGSFYMARDIALMPAFDLLNKALTPLLPAFARSKNSNAKLNYKVTFSLLFVNLLAFPICSLMYCAADSIILVLLGEKWIHTVDIFISFIPLTYLACIAPIFAHALVSRQIVKITFWVDVIALLMHVVPFAIATEVTLNMVVVIRTVALATTIVILIVALANETGFSPLRGAVLSSLPAMVSIFSLFVIDRLISMDVGFLSLCLQGGLLFTIYIVAIFLFGRLANRIEEVGDFYALLLPVLKKFIIKTRR